MVAVVVVVREVEMTVLLFSSLPPILYPLPLMLHRLSFLSAFSTRGLVTVQSQDLLPFLSAV